MPKMEKGKYPASAKTKRDKKAYDKAAGENKKNKAKAAGAAPARQDPRSARVNYEAPTGRKPKPKAKPSEKGIAGEITKKKNQVAKYLRIFSG
jgi:hypothetical protein